MSFHYCTGTAQFTSGYDYLQIVQDIHQEIEIGDRPSPCMNTTQKLVLSALVLIGCLLLLPLKVSAETLVASSAGIKVISADGSQNAVITSTPARGLFFHTSASKIYFTTTTDTIRRINYDGTNEVEIVAAQMFATPQDVVVDDGTNSIIWTDSTNAQVLRANLDGTNTTSLYNGISQAGKLILDATNNVVYAVGLGEIIVIPTSGASPLLTINDFNGTGALGSVFVRSGKVYWSNTSTNEIKKANTDGSNILTILSTSNSADVLGIAFNSSISKLLYLSGSAGTSSVRSLSETGTGDSAFATIVGTDIEGDVAAFPAFNIPTPTHTPIPTATSTTVPTATSTTSPTATETPTPTNVPVRNTRAYMSILDPAGSESQIIWTDYRRVVHKIIGSDVAPAPSALAYSKVSKLLYYINKNGSNYDLYSMTPDGADIQKITSFTDPIDFMVADDRNSRLYFESISAGVIFSTTLLGHDRTTFVTGTQLGLGIFFIPSDFQFGSSSVIAWADGNKVYAKKTDLGSETDQLATCFGTSKLALTGIYSLQFYVGCNTRVHGAVSVRLSQGEFFGYATSSAQLPFVASVIGIQSLDPQTFTARYAIYIAKDNQVYIHIPISAYPDVAKNQFVAPFLNFSSGTQVKAIIEVPVDANVGTPTATPTPPASSAKVSITGRVGESIASPSTLAVSLKGIPVYLQRSSEPTTEATTPSPDQESRVTLTDANGTYRFTNVTQGLYTLRFGRNDLAFFNREISTNAGEEIPTILTQPLNLDSVGCSAKVVSNKVTAASTKALSIPKGVLKQAVVAIEKSKNPATLNAAVAVVTAKEKSVVDAANDLVTAELKCSKTTTCIKFNSKAKNKAFTSAVKALAKASTSLSKKVVATYPKSKRAAKLKPLLAGIDKASEAALEKAKALSNQSYDCEAALNGDTTGVE